MGVQERLQQEVQPVHVRQRVLPVGQALQPPRVVLDAGEPELADQGAVGLLLVVQERRAPRDVARVGRERPPRARLAPSARLEGGPAPAVGRDRDAQLVARQAPLEGAVGVALGLRRGDRVVRLVNLDAPGEDGAVLDPVEHEEELGEPPGRGGRRPAVRAGYLADAVEGEQLDDELAPIRDRHLAPLEDGPRGGRERPAAGPAGPAPDAARVETVAHDVGRRAPRAGCPLVPVEELRVPGGRGVPGGVGLAVGPGDERLGGRDVRFGDAVPRRRGRRGHLLPCAHGGGPIPSRGMPRDPDHHVARARHPAGRSRGRAMSSRIIRPRQSGRRIYPHCAKDHFSMYTERNI